MRLARPSKHFRPKPLDASSQPCDCTAMMHSTENTDQTNSWRSHVAATLSLGLPLVGAQMAQVSIGATDAVMIGWLGARELAASTLGATAFFVVLMFGSGFAFAVIPMVSQGAATNDVETVSRATRTGLWITALYSALMMVPLWFIEPILLFGGQDADIAAMTASYVRIMQWSLFPALFVMVLRSFFSGLQKPRVVLFATITAALINALVNYALIFGNFGMPRLELQGAAIASLASTLLSLLVLCVRIESIAGLRRFRLFAGLHRPDVPALRELLRHGLPISLTIVAEVGLFAAASTMMGWLGAVPLAAHGIALQLASLVFMIPLGLSSAAAVRVGEAHALGQTGNVRRAALVVVVMSIIVSTLSAAAFLIFPEVLVSLFLDYSNPDAKEVLAYGIVLMAMAASFQLVDGLQAIGAGILRGLKDTARPALIAVVSYWGVGFPVAWWLGFGKGWLGGFGGPGVWAGLALGLGVAAILLNWRFALRTRP